MGEYLWSYPPNQGRKAPEIQRTLTNRYMKKNYIHAITNEFRSLPEGVRPCLPAVTPL
ncbi:hypothetical protein [Robiginitalea marina]|uniref:Uncharacterized protein n=1 Tax=Robiginitalea marina TaxID=2954105 RepID=A0ABT1B0R1_9FLAO|nr:hypothetical protein [Robiginitalea marina]MCO5725837.1 hypothetical protein [Robiginitalea marina]